MRRCRSDISSIKFCYFSLVRKTPDSVLRQLPWTQNWCLILVIRLSFRTGVMQQQMLINIMKDFVYRELHVLAIYMYQFQRRKTEQKLPKFQIAITMITLTSMWFDLAFQRLLFSKSMTMMYRDLPGP